MSNKYLNELAQINNTYEWAKDVEIEKITDFISASQNTALISVGSGGSFTVAYLASLLHQCIGSFGKTATPLELSSNLINILQASSVIVVSASGKNKDILSAFKIAVDVGARNILGLCMRKHSPLALLSSQYNHTLAAEYSPPYGKDGFLATNSLIASSVMLIRAYSEFTTENWTLPSLLPTLEETELYLNDPATNNLLATQTWIILFSGWTGVAAIDLESKCTEAGLVHVQLADFRNFGHGRHHWLAKNPKSSGVIIFSSPEDETLALKTLKQIPKAIPQLLIKTPYRGPVGSLYLLSHVLNLVQLLGQSQKVDVGQPGVPEFGRRLYHLSHSYSRKTAAKKKFSPNEYDAIIRKAKVIKLEELSGDAAFYWQSAYQNFMKKLKTAQFSAIVLDYDGTLCASDERYKGISASISTLLNNLLGLGIYIGIATGRGVSVRYDLQAKIPPQLWHKVLLGYYNGGDIGFLGDNQRPETSEIPHNSLERLQNIIVHHPILSDLITLQLRPKQLSITAARDTSWDRIRNIVNDMFNRAALPDLKLFESSHSLDVVVSSVSKKNLFTALKTECERQNMFGEILCIGDRGEWPGNDFELLSTPYSLSVDTVSPDADTCWNINLLAYRGVQGTVKYLNSLQVENHSLKFKPDE